MNTSSTCSCSSPLGPMLGPTVTHETLPHILSIDLKPGHSQVLQGLPVSFPDLLLLCPPAPDQQTITGSRLAVNWLLCWFSVKLRLHLLETPAVISWSASRQWRFTIVQPERDTNNQRLPCFNSAAAADKFFYDVIIGKSKRPLTSLESQLGRGQEELGWKKESLLLISATPSLSTG